MTTGNTFRLSGSSGGYVSGQPSGQGATVKSSYWQRVKGDAFILRCVRVEVFSLWLTLLGLLLRNFPLGQVTLLTSAGTFWTVIFTSALLALLMAWATLGIAGVARVRVFSFSVPVRVSWPTPRHKRVRRRI
jgi:hypothetical protein